MMPFCNLLWNDPRINKKEQQQKINQNGNWKY